jgi:hypothetical protein
MYRLTSNHKRAFPKMMNRLWMFHQWVNPGFENFKDKIVVFSYHLFIYNLAFKIGIAFVDKRSLDARSGHCCETKIFELVDGSPGTVPTVHYFFRELHRGNVDYAFFGCFHYIKGVVPVTDDATDKRWLKIKHGVPRQGHDVRLTFSGCGDHDYWPRFKQTIDFGQGKGFF